VKKRSQGVKWGRLLLGDGLAARETALHIFAANDMFLSGFDQGFDTEIFEILVLKSC
jgi:hypothetical protein